MKFFKEGWLQPKRINEGDEPIEPIESGLDVADRRPNPEEALVAAPNDSEADDEEIDLSSEEHGGPYVDHSDEGAYPFEQREQDEQYMAQLGRQMADAEQSETAPDVSSLKTPSQGSVEGVGTRRAAVEKHGWDTKRMERKMTGSPDNSWKQHRDDQSREAA